MSRLRLDDLSRVGNIVVSGGPARQNDVMHRHFFSLRIALYVVLAAILFASLDLGWRGFVVVHDPDGVVANAALDNGRERRALHEFTPGYLVARPSLEGAVRIVCDSGAILRRGYVTPGTQTGITVTRPECTRLAERRARS